MDATTQRHPTKVRPMALLMVLAVSCVSSEITNIGPRYAARELGCRVEVFPSTKPPYPYVNLATTRAKCDSLSGRTACIERLEADACEVGADTVYAFVEGVAHDYTLISATLAHRTGEAAAVDAAALNIAGARTAAHSGECSPPCSPGFECNANVCQPVCNPPCQQGETCTPQRICAATRIGM